MQFRIPNPPPIPDLEAIHAALVAADPSAAMGFDRPGQALRVATCMGRQEPAATLAGAGLPLAPDALEALHFECRGGCGG